MSLRARITALSMVGRVRQRNEDCVGAGGWLLAAQIPVGIEVALRSDETLLVALADGMGGHPGGDVASRIAIQTMLEHGSALFSERDCRSAIEAADAALAARMGDEPALTGMGTTLAGLALRFGEYLQFNVGDSRIYRVFDGYLRQTSVDDNAICNDGDLSRSNILTSYLGGKKPGRRVDAHVRQEVLHPPGRWLLCSDGLSDMVSDTEIETVLQAPDHEAIVQLGDLAMKAGGADNISIVLVTVS